MTQPEPIEAMDPVDLVGHLTDAAATRPNDLDDWKLDRQQHIVETARMHSAQRIHNAILLIDARRQLGGHTREQTITLALARSVLLEAFHLAANQTRSA